MKILVDADACPVKQIIIKVAKENNIPVIMFIDTSHELNDGYSRIVTVEKGRDSVDFALINNILKGDIAVTQDFGVATMALAKGAAALNHNGLIFNEDNIDKLLFERHISQKVRRSGGRTKGPKKRIKRDDEKFEKALRYLIGRRNNMGIYKAYDIRGIYNKDFDKNDAYKIGYFIPKLLKSDRVLVGHDCRESSNEIFEYLAKGICDSGADVYYLGYSTTPMVYYATAKYDFDASIQITASHNPKEYNGFKVSRKGALPVGYETGLKELEEMVLNDKIIVSENKGEIKEFDVKSEYINFLKQYMPENSELKMAVDCSNGMASILIKEILGENIEYIFDNLDGSFPNHEPNPLIEENLEDLKKVVLKNGCDVGIIYDGDGDRVVFVDEKGRFVPPDLVIGLMCRHYLDKEKGYVLHDIRTSKSVSEYIVKLGGTPYMWKVGHAYAKLKLREIQGIFGGELAGHYYFRDFFNCDSGILASLIVLKVLSDIKKEGKTFSQFIDSINVYYNSGEVNFRIEQKKEVMEHLKEKYTKNLTPNAFYDFDGYRIEFDDWWFNVRTSNTEPYLRLLVEAKNKELLDEKLNEIREILHTFK